MNDSNMQENRPRGPRLYHKKSRTGCLRCKQRRVKCDEVRPSCGSCSRHAVECLYSNLSHAPSAASAAGKAALANQHAPHADDVSHRGPATRLGSFSGESKPAYSPQSSGFYPSPSSSHPTPADDGTDAEITLPEGPWRRLWELRLMHNYCQNMVQPFPVAQTPEVVNMWAKDIPNLAMDMAQQHNRCTLLNAILANSALYIWTQSTDKQERDELLKLQQTYQYMFSREQRRDIDELTQNVSRHADYVCFTAIRILAHSIALVQTLTVDPWEPPVQWLYMGRGAGEILNMTRNLVKTESAPKISVFTRGPPDMSDPKKLLYLDHSSLDWLLEHPAGAGSVAGQEDRELEDENVKSVYSKALSFTCSVQKAIDDGEPDYAIVRRFGGFAIFIPIEFTRFIEERRPRAMVVLAHFMALWVNFEHIWMIGRAGEWQIRGIYKVLPIEWSYKLDGLFARFKQPETSK